MIVFIIAMIGIQRLRMRLIAFDGDHFRRFYTDEEWHNQCFKAAWIGVDLIRLYHTIGMTTPHDVYLVFKKILQTDPFDEYDFSDE